MIIKCSNFFYNILQLCKWKLAALLALATLMTDIIKFEEYFKYNKKNVASDFEF